MRKLAVTISTSLIVLSNTVNALPYVGAKVGYTWIDDECQVGYLCDDDKSGSVGIYGGYTFNNFLAVEAGYDYLGKFTGAGLSDDSIDAFTLAPKLTFGINDAVNVYGKLGGAYVNYGDKSDESFLGALGLEFDVIENGSIRVEYQSLTDINNDIVRAKANTAYIGFSYRFGGNKQEAAASEYKEEVEKNTLATPLPTKTFQATLLSNTFESSSSQLKSESLSQLDELVEFLEKYPQAQVNITGYTDSSGAESYNQVLSEKRAKAVAKVLTDRGISPDRLTATGKGESGPIASNDTLEGRAKNRRVEISVPEFEYQQ
ncbi:OmpA family protein [Vibrio pectenicida]|uniref:OmpA family protein n=1 Tax=Vibrio pectenicida TaxID=62763 RepID=A0A7Y4EG49_9VIBR|nr:OmpA family protein [Vibrio pectenicida]NOH73113.1 OmpA family protein [Vibrio pectenicida]